DVAHLLGNFFGLVLKVLFIEIAMNNNQPLGLTTNHRQGGRDAGQILEKIETEVVQDFRDLVTVVDEFAKILQEVLLDNARVKNLLGVHHDNDLGVVRQVLVDIGRTD